MLSRCGFNLVPQMTNDAERIYMFIGHLPIFLGNITVHRLGSVFNCAVRSLSRGKIPFSGSLLGMSMASAVSPGDCLPCSRRSCVWAHVVSMKVTLLWLLGL